MAGKQPLPYPMFGGALLAKLEREAREAGEKEQAADTPFRFSQATDCTRKMALRAAGFEATNPMDGPSLMITSNGTWRHEDFQASIAEQYPNSQFELKGIVEDLTSGHVDGLIDIGGVLHVWELKNVGSYAADKSIGLDRRNAYKTGRFDNPEGPRLSAIIQGGFNAIAHNAEVVVITYAFHEAISVQLARRLGIGTADRIMAEWRFERHEWEPPTLREIQRLRDVRSYLEAGWIPVGYATDDNGEQAKLNPTLSQVHWRCDYCDRRDLCEQLDPNNPVKVEHVESVPVAIRKVPVA